jgi:transcriptional regulator with XRE-family HTH domain
MSLAINKKNQSAASVLRRLREKAELTTRQAAGIIGVTHTTISQFENGKRDITGYRVEELVKAYGYGGVWRDVRWDLSLFGNSREPSPLLHVFDLCLGSIDGCDNDDWFGLYVSETHARIKCSRSEP